MRVRETIVAAVIASVVSLVLSSRMHPLLAAAIGIAASTLAMLLLSRYAKTGDERSTVGLANLTHEIRTPLNGILGLTQLLIRMQPSTQQREYLEAIKSSGQSLQRLVDDVLDYSKMRSGALHFEQEPFPLRKWVRETVRSLAPQAHLSGLELAFWVEPDVPDDLVGDPDRLRQVLVNLIVNAIRYTRAGEVVVAVSLESLDENAVTIRFRVSDTGVGVPEHERGRIFEAFARGGGGALTADKSGVGLGLAIAKDLVARMNGSIGVETSSPRTGSTFNFTARFERPIDGAIGDDLAPAEPQSGLRVLVVDDSGAQLTALDKQMSAWGFDVITARDEAAALDAMAESGPFSLLLLDSHIPGIDVWALATKLQELNPTPGVLMSLAHEHVDTDVLRAHGFHGHLTKPLAPTHLLRAIEIIRRGATVDTPEDIETHDMERLALGGIRVLLADDHPVNRTVALRLLEKIGCTVTAVSDGQKALELLKREPFDIGLVDIHMPVVDGLALARAIRAREGSGDHLPLIAVTANTDEEDRERCRNAGMDAFLSKPFREEDLVSLMKRCLAKTNAGDPEPRLNRAVALTRTNGDTVLLAELSAIFIDEAPETLAAIEEALRASDLPTVERLAHRLKGALLTLSVDRASTLALALETTARSESRARCEAVLAELNQELDRVTPELEALAGSVSSH